MVRRTSSDSSGRSLAIAFGTTVAMWVVCYVSMINPGLVIGEILFAMVLACLLIGGVVTGRNVAPTESAAAIGARIGVVVALLNLLIVGALLLDPHTHRFQHNAGWWIIGDFAASIALVSIGSIIGSRWRRGDGFTINWFYRFMIVAAVTVFLLLITGGLVTGKEAGLAVPDWPTSFGHNMLLYPLSEMNGGKYFEHAHRLYGMLVGVTAITVAVSMFYLDQRGWLRALALVYLSMVCVQGVLGGTRVTELSRTLAIIHGIFGQIVFATIVCMAAFTSDTWKSNRPAIIQSSASLDRGVTMTLLVMFIVQLVLGATYRHLQRESGIPPEPLHALYAHIVMAGLVTITAILAAGRAWGVHRDQPVLPVVGQAVLALLGAQLVLGISSLIAVWSSKPSTHSAPEVIVTTAHQATGALLLATAALLMIWTRRLLAVAEIDSRTLEPLNAAQRAR